jgi:hypothetical protein
MLKSIASVSEATRSKAWVCGRSIVETAGSNLTGNKDVSIVSVVFCIGRGLCDILITHPEESYLVCGACVWSINLDNEEALAHWGLLSDEEEKV